MKKLIYTTTLSLLIAVVVTSCGWHLRGNNKLDTNLSTIYLSGLGKQSDFYRSLSRSLNANDIVITNSALKAEYTLVMQNRKTERRTATVSSSARVSEYQLTESIDIIILDAKGTQLLENTTLQAERFFDFDENNVQSMNEEANLLQKEMLNDLVLKVMLQLHSISQRSPRNPGSHATKG